MNYKKNCWKKVKKQHVLNRRTDFLVTIKELLGFLNQLSITGFIINKVRNHYDNIRSIVYTDNYMPTFSNDLFRLLANYFPLLGSVNIPDTINWFSKTQLRVGTRSLGWQIFILNIFSLKFLTLMIKPATVAQRVAHLLVIGKVIGSNLGQTLSHN